MIRWFKLRKYLIREIMQIEKDLTLAENQVDAQMEKLKIQGETILKMHSMLTQAQSERDLALAHLKGLKNE